MRVLLSRVRGDQGAHALGHCARTLARHAAASVLREPPARVGLGAERGGRPLLEVIGRPAHGWHVALSHTRIDAGGENHGGIAAAALSRLGPVGLDVEVVRDLPALALARRWLAPEETDWLARQPRHHQTIAFLLLWTQKEAVGKALGIGLRGSGLLRRVPLPRFPTEDERLPSEDEPCADRRRLAAISAEPPMSLHAWVRGDLVVAVACAGPSAPQAPISVRELNAGELDEAVLW